MLNHKYTASAAPGPQKGGSPLRPIARFGGTLVPVTPDVAHRLHGQRCTSLCHSVARRRLGNIGHMCGIRGKTNDTRMYLGCQRCVGDALRARALLVGSFVASSPSPSYLGSWPIRVTISIAPSHFVTRRGGLHRPAPRTPRASLLPVCLATPQTNCDHGFLCSANAPKSVITISLL